MMKIKIDETSFLSIDNNSFGLLLPKVHQVEALQKFRDARRDEFEKLTAREKQILKLMAEGYNNPQIAARLDISRRTVENHRKHINRKLHISHFRDIIKYALAFGLVPFKQK